MAIGTTIDGLNAVTSLTTNDEVPVWDKEASGEPTKKITASNLASSVKSLASLPNTTEMNAAISQSTAVTTGVCGDHVYTSHVVTSINKLEKINGMVHIQLQMVCESGYTFTTSTAFNIPTGFRPSRETDISLMILKNNAYCPGVGAVDSLGNGWQNFSSSVDGIFIDTWYKAVQ